MPDDRKKSVRIDEDLNKAINTLADSSPYMIGFSPSAPWPALMDRPPSP
jgi:hypothetical protein